MVQALRGLPLTGAVAVEVGLPALRFFPVPGFALPQPLLHSVICSSKNAAAWPELAVSQGPCALSCEEQVEMLCVAV